MKIVFEHIQNHTTNGQPSSPQRFYRMLSPVFDSSVLTTHKSKFVQFVLLYVCGLEVKRSEPPPVTRVDEADTNMGTNGSSPPSEALYRHFCGRLIDVVLDPYRATVTRQSGACYLASFISRASFVCPETVCESVSALLRWTEAYIASFANSRNRSKLRVSDTREQCELHSLFYTVCQAAFYAMCFRGKDAIDYYRLAMAYHNTPTDGSTDDDGLRYADPEHVDISRDRWTRLCTHELQPLRYCLESVRGEFLRVAGTFELLEPTVLVRLESEDRSMSSYPRKTLRTRKATLIATSATLEKKRAAQGVGGLGQGSNPLDSFFPFDPYLLRNSHKFIDPFYRDWEAATNDCSPDVDLVTEDGDAVVAVENDIIGKDDDDDDDSDYSAGEGNDDDDDDEEFSHMPESVGSSSYLQPMSISVSDRGDFMDGSRSNVPVTTAADSVAMAIQKKRQDQEQAWSKTLTRPRAPSIENGSW